MVWMNHRKHGKNRIKKTQKALMTQIEVQPDYVFAMLCALEGHAF